MDYTPVTPFRRMVDAAILKHQSPTDQPLPPNGVNKWEVLRELGAARTAFGLSDRDMTVLQALVSFHPNTVLGGNDPALVVHPSNASICERLNGMACSTMRRHVAHLVDAGVIVRRDSPNGKRFARRYGDEKVVFGFDLTPLVARFAEFCAAAEAVRAREAQYARLRQAVSLMRRDLAGLVAYGRETCPRGANWDAYADMAVLAARDLRRKLALEALTGLSAQLEAALNVIRDVLEPGARVDAAPISAETDVDKATSSASETEIMSTNGAQGEQHCQNSNKDSYVFEPRLEQAGGEGGAQPPSDAPVGVDAEADTSDGEGLENAERALVEDRNLPNIPLALVLSNCHEFKSYTDGNIRHWHELVQAADIVRPMMGISPSAWDDAKRHMGPEEAAVVLVAMLERFSDIRSPGGYMRALTVKAADNAFSCGPMIMALMRKSAA